MAAKAEKEYIKARQNRFVEAYKSQDVAKVMDFMDPDDFIYSDFAHTEGHHEDLTYAKLKSQFEDQFQHVHKLKIRTVSLNGDKKFTAWEWVMTFRAGKIEGKKLKAEDAVKTKIKGCSLLWWNDKDKITRNHNYQQWRPADEEND